MTRSTSKPGTKQELMIAVWDDLGRGMVGAPELRKIQRSIRARFGQKAVSSPAAIARVLADKGAELRHPEVIELDARWRQAKIASETKRFEGLEAVAAGKPLRLDQAETLIMKLAGLINESDKAGDQTGVRSAQKIAVEVREIARSMARDLTLDQTTRNEQAEIAEWFAVWIQTPRLFEEWLELRRRSADFRQKFRADANSKPQARA
jgi:hypothetical protein